LSLNITENDNSLDLGLLKSQAPAFRITAKSADAIVRAVRKAVAGWDTVAAKHGIGKMERRQMAGAFERSFANA
jgi:hypothetical protein